MLVYSFQLQLKNTTRTVTELIHELDPLAPIPEPLEGGDGKGPLYQCIFDARKDDLLMRHWKDGGEALIYTFFTKLEIDDKLYRPDYYVQWRFGAEPTVLALRNETIF